MRPSAEFLQSELRAFLAALKAGGIAFLPVDRFAERYAAYYATDPRAGRPPGEPFGMIKLDIHRNIERPLELARMLAELGIPALFLMMPRHPFTEAYYDKPRTWDILREIRGLGHEIGLHPDLFHLIRVHGDLYKGLGAALDDVRKRGFEIRTATVHGDTRAHIKACRLQANDFFTEEFRRSKWNGRAPEGEEYLADHVRKYSHKTIARDLGIEYFAEVNFVRRGEIVNDESMLYLSDNKRALELRNIPGRAENYSAPVQFRIAPEFTRDAAAILKERPFLALFHPQWYRA